MAKKCGQYKYCCKTNCILHPFKMQECELVKRCDCNVCSPLMALTDSSYSLYETCLAKCQTSPTKYKDYKQFLCENYDPSDLYFQHGGIIACGFNPKESDEFKEKEKQEQKNDQAAAGQSKTIQFLMFAVLVLAVIWFVKR